MSLYSGVSSLHGEDDMVTLQPTRRGSENDREYLKYVRIQMWWNFISALFLGIYGFAIACIAIFWVQVHHAKWFDLQCSVGLEGNYSVWAAGNGFTEMFITLHPVLVIMSATFNYFVFFSIPYRLNRIQKTEKEI